MSLEGVAFPHRKALLLLAYLSVEGPQDRRRLAALFWPRAGDPLNQLAVNLSRLRRRAPGVVEADRYRAWSLVRTDVDDVMDMLAAGEADAARAAHAAPFLRDVRPRNVSEEVQEWIFATAERLVSDIRSALIDVAEGSAAEGAFREAADRAEDAWLLQGTAVPDRTAVRRVHTLLLAGPNPRRVEVRREAQDLGVDLVDSVERARAMLRGRRAPATPHTNLPDRTATFVGRERERRELRERLLSPGHRLVTIVGPGGSGKSRLAEQVGRELLATGEMEGGVQLVELDGRATPNGLIAEIAATLAIEVRGAGHGAEELALALGDARRMLILDGFDPALHDAGPLGPLIRGHPGLVVLATAQRPMGLRDEGRYPIEGLAFEERQAVPADALDSDAARLFVERASRLLPDFAPTEEEAPFIGEICRLTWGSPLALELAAAWVDLLPLRDIATEIEQDLDFLHSHAPDVPERHRSLRGIFAHAWRRLDRSERDVLARLSVFEGGFDRVAAAAVAGAEMRVIASLRAASFLHRRPLGRFDLHPLIRQYAREALEETPAALAETEAAHTRYFSQLPARLQRAAFGPRQGSIIAQLVAEHDNSRAAWTRALELADAEAILRLAREFYALYGMLGRVRDALRSCDEALAVLDPDRAAHAHVVGEVLGARAAALFRSGRYAEAVAAAERGVEILRPTGSVYGEAICRMALGRVALAEGRPDDAAEQFRRLAEVRALGKLGFRAWSAGVIAFRKGRFAAAHAHLLDALDSYRKDGDLGAELMTVYYLAEVCLHSGDADAALRHYRAVAQGRRTTYVYFQSAARIGTARALLELGDAAAAEAALVVLLERPDAVPFPELEVYVWSLAGAVARHRGDLGSAAERHGRALRAPWMSGSTISEETIYALRTAAELLLDLGREAAALRGLRFASAHGQRHPIEAPHVAEPLRRARAAEGAGPSDGHHAGPEGTLADVARTLREALSEASLARTERFGG